MFLNKDDIYMKPDTIIIRGSSEVLTAASFTQLTGQTKTAKTKVLMDITASCFGKKSAVGLEVLKCPDDKHVLYINTELSTYDFHQYMLKVYSLNNASDIPNLHFMQVLGESIKKIKTDLYEFCEEKKPYLIIVDGIADLIKDFNDISSSKSIIEEFINLSVTYSCGIILTIHQNPTIKSNVKEKSRGHLGTELQNKAISTMVTSKNESTGLFTLSVNRVRNGEEFKVNFKYNQNTKWIEPAENVVLKTDAVKLKMIDLLNEANGSMVQSQLIKLIMLDVKISQPVISGKFKSYIEKGIISKEGEHKKEIIKLLK